MDYKKEFALWRKRLGYNWRASISAMVPNGQQWFTFEERVFRFRWMARLWMFMKLPTGDHAIYLRERFGTRYDANVLAIEPEDNA